MGKIKKILERDLVGGAQDTDVYPVTAFKAVYNERNERLDDTLNRNLTINVSTEYNSDHNITPINLYGAVSKVPLSERALGKNILFLDVDNKWKHYTFVGKNISYWNLPNNWISSENSLNEYKNSISKVLNPILYNFSDKENLIGTVRHGHFNSTGDYVENSDELCIEATLPNGDYGILVTGDVLNAAPLALYYSSNVIIGSEKPIDASNGYLLSIPPGADTIKISSNSTARFEVLTNKIGFGNSTNHHIVNLNNIPKLVFIGTQFSGMGTLKYSSAINYISSMLDWNVEYCDTYKYRIEGSSDYSSYLLVLYNSIINLGISAYRLGNGGYAIICPSYEEESKFCRRGIDGKYYKDNIIRLCSAIKSFGIEPILCSQFGNSIHNDNFILQDIADEYGYKFINMKGYCSGFFNSFEAFSGNPIIVKPFTPHYAFDGFGTRTCTIQWYNLLKALNNLIDRPHSSIKIFRAKNTEEGPDNLLFDNNYEKMKHWVELDKDQFYLLDNSQVDNLDELTFSDLNNKTDSVYVELMNGGDVVIPGYLLIQATLPSVGRNIENLVFKGLTSLVPEGEGVQVFVRAYAGSDLNVDAIDYPTTMVFFISTPIIDETIIGSTYLRQDVEDTSEVTVVAIDRSRNLIITPNNHRYLKEIQGTATLVKKEGDGPDTLTIYKVLESEVRPSYYGEALSPKGRWVQLQESKPGIFPIPYAYLCMDYDRIDLLVHSDKGCHLNNLSFEFDSSIEKNKSIFKRKKSIFNNNMNFVHFVYRAGADDILNDWSWEPNIKTTKSSYWVDSSGSKYNTFPYKYKDYASAPEYDSISLDSGKSITSPRIGIAGNYGGDGVNYKYKIKIVAKYFPETDQLLNEDFHFAKMAVTLQMDSGESYFTKEFYVPLWYVDLEWEVTADQLQTTFSNSIKITALDNNIQIIYVEVQKIAVDGIEV